MDRREIAHQFVHRMSHGKYFAFILLDLFFQSSFLPFGLSQLELGVARCPVGRTMDASCVLGGLIELIRKLLDAALKAPRRRCGTGRVERLGLEVNDADVELLNLLLEIGLFILLTTFRESSQKITYVELLQLGILHSDFA